MKNKILIRTSDRKTLHKDRRSLGMNGENLQEVLLFCLDEMIEGNGIVEVELPNGEKGIIEVERTEEGYELPVKSSLLSQTGFVKFQLRILHDNEEIFKSEIIPLEVKDSINATATIPEEYPSWVDTLTNLKKDLEKAESERVSNENERISAEKTRQENFTKMQETVSSAVSNIKELTEEYNSNAEKETKKFNDNAVDQTNTFNDNSDSKSAEYNKNHTDKIKEYDDNSKAKLDAYNKNNTDKTNAYNDNTVLKEKAYNDNATSKTEAFNTNVEQKENELENLAEEKINEYNQVSAELTAKVEQVQAENEALKAENKLIKEQIPSASMSGHSIHVEDSGTLDFDWKINGNQYQATREGYNLIDIQNNNRIFMNLASDMKHENYENGILFNYDYDSDYAYHNAYRFAFIYYPFKKNKQYRLSWKTQNLGEIPQSLQYYFPEFEQYLTLNNAFTPQNDTNWIAIFVKTDDFVEGCKVAITDVMLTEGSEIKPYEQYGASPSPDYPSEIETVKDNVEIDVVNKNYLTKAQQQTKTFNNVNFEINENGEINIQGLANASGEVIFELERPCKMSDLINKIVELIVEGTPTATIGMRFFDGNTRLFELIPKSKTVTLNLDDNYINKNITAIQFYINNTADYNLIIKPGIYAEFQTEFTPHQSQTAIMPIQQEMLDGDYVADVEHHEWKKLILTGEENFDYLTSNNVFLGYFTQKDIKRNNVEINVISNKLLGIYNNQWTYVSQNKDFLVWSNSAGVLNIIIKEYATAEELKNYLKQQYEAGTPVVVYYKLATPVNLELTEEQKAVREQKLYTYKNITNIDVSDELASIDVNYKKDQTTEHDELQNQIDEIKQLISTTETSALLLDNLQKDVETEVE